MQPYLTLRIKNHIPHIFFHSDEVTNKQLTHKDENILQEIKSIGQKLGLNNVNLTDEDQLNDLFTLASEADNGMIESLPEIDIESLEFDIHNTIAGVLEKAMDADDEYKDLELSEEIRNELNRNRNSDILASVIDQIYDIIIAKTLLAAYELELAEIHFDSDYNYSRFIEKLGNELQKLGLELTIDNQINEEAAG